jgi:hypothetical protein
LQSKRGEGDDDVAESAATAPMGTGAGAGRVCFSVSPQQAHDAVPPAWAAREQSPWARRLGSRHLRQVGASHPGGPTLGFAS